MAIAAATYTGDPENVPIDKVRALVGDTTDGSWLLFDSEIEWCISEYGASGFGAAAQAAELIAAKLTRRVDYSAGKSRQSEGKLAEQYRALARDLRARGALEAVPYAGGLSEAEALDDEQDTDLRGPSFYKDQFANPSAPQDPGSGGSSDADS